jgi:hypothetical protein
MGDFNEIMDQKEKMGGALRSHAQMENFRRVVQECNFGDLGYKGSKFTWSNKRESGIFVKERLDRALATPEWCAQYPNVIVEVSHVTNSDHKRLWLYSKPHVRPTPKLFRFEACWNVDEDCGTVIEQAWNRELECSNSVENAILKLDLCKIKLAEWSKQKHGTGRHSMGPGKEVGEFPTPGASWNDRSDLKHSRGD